MSPYATGPEFTVTFPLDWLPPDCKKMKGQSRGHFHCLQTFLFLFFWLFEAAWHVAFACVQRRRVRFLVPGYLPCRILVVSPKLECHGHPRDRRREGLGSVNSLCAHPACITSALFISGASFGAKALQMNPRLSCHQDTHVFKKA